MRLIPLYVLAVWLLIFAETRGWTSTDQTWADPAVTHTEDATLSGYVGVAFAQWGAHSAIRDGGPGNDVTITLGNAAPAAGVTRCWSVGSGHADTTHCEIVLSRTYWTYTDETMRQRLMTHEMGHALGLGHSDAGVMCATLCSDFSDDDAAGIAALYPLPRRAFMPMVVS